MMDTFNIKNIDPHAPSVGRAIGILKTLGQAKEPQGVSSLARTLGIGKSSAHAIIQALLVFGAIEDVGQRKYRLGPLVEELAGLRRGERSLADICKPHLAALAMQVGQTCLFGTPEQERFRIVSAVEGWGSFQVKVVVGGASRCSRAPSARSSWLGGLRLCPMFCPGSPKILLWMRRVLGEELKGVRREAFGP